MGFDGLFIYNIANNLNKTIAGSRINKIIAVSNNEFLFDLYKPNLKKNLFIAVNQNYTHLTLTEKKYNSSLEVFHFFNILKKHIENYYIEEVKQINFDRIIAFTLKGKNEIGTSVTKYLYLEIMGRYNNLILTKENQIIIDSLHRLPFIDKDKRIILPGYEYMPPYLEKKKNPLLDKVDFSYPFSMQFYGISSYLERLINIHRPNKEFKEIIQEIVTSDTLFYNEDDFHLIPLDKDYQKAELFQGIENFFSLKTSIDRAKRKSNDTLKIINNLLKKISNKINKLKEEEKDIANADKYKEYGELLFTYQENYTKGATNLYLDDLDIIIPLDKTKDLVDNANNYFKKYRKLVSSKKYLEEQIALANEEKEYLEDILEQLDTLDLEIIEEIKEELRQQNYLKDTKQNNKKTKPKKLNILTIKAKDNSNILIGRNNLQNEYLTFKVAKPNDLFLHVKDYRGAHVIIQNYQGNPETLKEAALLAAKYSKAKYSSTVPIDYTLVKNVKKVNSGKPGKVLLKEYKTIYVDPK